MADIDIDPFGEHDRTESRTDETGENISLTPVGGEGSTREPTRERETSFGGERHENEIFKEDKVKELYQLIGNKIHQRLEPNLDLFELGKDGRLYCNGKPLMNRKGEL